ncbi:cation transporter [Paenibacillus sp. LjRoot153]|uniref:cation transporter n=1 Tax=Paenibacillus sp. LjRoot153 TaxID=3342270 RepID=UPI003ECD9B1E
MQSVTLSVQGMSCNHCVITVSGALYKFGATATIDLSSGSVTVQYDPSKLSLEAIQAAIEEQGYDVTGIRAFKI